MINRIPQCKWPETQVGNSWVSKTVYSLGSEAVLYVSENDHYEKKHIDIQSVPIISYLEDRK